MNKFILHLHSQKKGDPVAQQVEHIPFKDGVLGSNPSWITNSHAFTNSEILFSVKEVRESGQTYNKYMPDIPRYQGITDVPGIL